MDNETTRIMQSDETTQVAPQEQKTLENNTAVAPKTGKKKGGLAAAAVAAGVAGAAGAGAGAAAMHFAAPNEEEETPDEQLEPQTAEVHTAEQAIHHEPQPEHFKAPAPGHDVDYTGNAGYEPALGSDAPEEDGEIEVLGVYNNEDGSEVAVITDGEEVGVVVDLDDDGEANLLGIDENHNQHIEENEVYDISDQHVDMAQFGDPTNSGQEYVSEPAPAAVDDSYHPEYVSHEYHSDPQEDEQEAYEHHHDDYEPQHEEFEHVEDYNDYQDVSGDECQDDSCETFEC